MVDKAHHCRLASYHTRNHGQHVHHRHHRSEDYPTGYAADNASDYPLRQRQVRVRPSASQCAERSADPSHLSASSRGACERAAKRGRGACTTVSEASPMTEAPIYRGEIPYVTTEQMIEVDRAMIEDFGIELVQMMENAGRALAHLARARFLRGDSRDKRVIVMAGTGGNGGGGLVGARRLHGWGGQVKGFLTKPERGFPPVPAHPLPILSQMHVEVDVPDIPIGGPSPDLIIDGVIGYSLSDAPRGIAGELIRWANAQGSPILALDVPSGVDATTGTVFDPAIAATATMTLALPKEGLRAPGVEGQVGELYLADISVPPSLYARPPLGLHVAHIFSESDIVRLP